MFIGLNVAVSGGCFAILSQDLPDGSSPPLQTIFVSAFGAPVLLRSRLFDIRSGDRIIQVGPGFLIDEFLRIVDRQIDRKRAKLRLSLVTEAMRRIDFLEVKDRAFLLVTNSLQRLTKEESESFKGDIKAIASDVQIALEDKSLAMGFVILDVTGEKLFTTIVKELELQLTHLKSNGGGEAVV